ncbi:MAG TPA: hypothetical protein VNL92_00540 [Dehalococcoidia bacterium]|nr:hypothetical protein [Dehalococcoidia bacterium]
MILAKRAMERAGIASFDDLGAYYLGATTPDIRVLTRWERERTHFFDLHCVEPQSSVDRLFEVHPELARPEQLSPSTVAFVAGYLSHLSMDEQYIQDVYRPHFGVDSTLIDRARANLMDRVLQYELDLRQRADPTLVHHLQQELRASQLDIRVAFLDKETLERWREVSAEVAGQPVTWERFRHIAARHLRAAGIESDEELEAFIRDLPRLLDETISHVQAERIDEFLERSIDVTARAIARYLDCG